MAGTLYVVATPIGNLEDITVRALRVLREVVLIAAEDTRRTAHLLARYGIATRTTSLHQHNERTKTAGLINRLKSGESIALVSDGGTPTISDPGAHFVGEAIAAGIRVEPLPGPSAAIAALSASGIVSEGFSFMGFPPTKSKERALWIERLRHLGPTVVFNEAPHRIRWTLEELQREFGDMPVVVARELTKKHEEFLRGLISTVLPALASPVGEFTVVLDMCRTTNDAPSQEPSAADVVAEFCETTNNGGLTRRQGVSALSRKYKISAKKIYSIIEAAKKSVH